MNLEDFESLGQGEMLTDEIMTAVMNTAVIPPDILIGRPNWYGNVYGQFDPTRSNPTDPIEEHHRR